MIMQLIQYSNVINNDHHNENNANNNNNSINNQSNINIHNNSNTSDNSNTEKSRQQTGRGQMGSALMGSPRISCFWAEGFSGTPVT